MDARESVVGIGRILFSSLSTLPVPQQGTPAFLPFLVAYGINPQALCCCNATEVVEFLSRQSNPIERVQFEFRNKAMKDIHFLVLEGHNPVMTQMLHRKSKVGKTNFRARCVRG